LDDAFAPVLESQSVIALGKCHELERYLGFSSGPEPG
jgi:hypothetical protein